MKKLTQKLAIIALLAGLSLAVSACLKKPNPVVNQNQNVNQNTNQPIDQNVNTNTATTTKAIDTSNWKTYWNEEYGFEFKYPPRWELYAGGSIIQLASRYEPSGNSVFVPEDEIYMEFHFLLADDNDLGHAGQNNKQWCDTDLILYSDAIWNDKYNNLNILDKGFEDINGEKVFSINYIMDNDKRFIKKNLCLMNNDKIVFVLAEHLDSNSRFLPTYYEILSSFKFLSTK
ncbi:MAG: hypothetical protein WC675_04705 [Patescibacteria group bacterium]|jgi:hypothetical protein